MLTELVNFEGLKRRFEDLIMLFRATDEASQQKKYKIIFIAAAVVAALAGTIVLYNFAFGTRDRPGAIFRCQECGYQWRLPYKEARLLTVESAEVDCPKCEVAGAALPMRACPVCDELYPLDPDKPVRLCPDCKTDIAKWYQDNPVK